MKSLRGFPIAIEKDGAQIEQGLSAGDDPAPAGPLHAGDNQFLASQLDRPGADGESDSEIVVRTHSGAIGTKQAITLRTVSWLIFLVMRLLYRSG